MFKKYPNKGVCRYEGCEQAALSPNSTICLIHRNMIQAENTRRHNRIKQAMGLTVKGKPRKRGTINN